MIEKDRIKVLKKGIEEGFYPRYLYKYWPFESAKRYLCTGSIRFAQYFDFNDPFEGAFSIIGNNSSDEMISYFKRTSDYPEEIVNSLPNVITPEEHKKMASQCIQQTLSQVGIFCMSKNNNNLLMWAHYANQHEGLCLKFDLLKDLSTFSSLHKVVYSTEFLNFNFITSPTRVNDILVHKSVDWMYEEEFRVLKLKCAGHILPVNPESLVEITFGSRMSIENKNIIKEIIANNPKYSVKYMVAGLHPQDYKVMILEEGDSRIVYK